MAFAASHRLQDGVLAAAYHPTDLSKHLDQLDFGSYAGSVNLD
ncbi:hypothetical protein J2Z17_004348 [Rhizobium halophytocola]|uniref:Uncharacterized protein n=1 Tax=Rhizobium halophytocola TaxID=735519 RepID=A0ABS4E4R1_9HYPH|nr:hypothetical protein [Rhizobium halophytocola]